MSKLGYFIGGTVVGALGVALYNLFTADNDINSDDNELDVQDNLSSITEASFIDDNVGN